MILPPMILPYFFASTFLLLHAVCPKSVSERKEDRKITDKKIRFWRSPIGIDSGLNNKRREDAKIGWATSLRLCVFASLLLIRFAQPQQLLSRLHPRPVGDEVTSL